MLNPEPPFHGLGGPPATGGTIHILGGGPGDPGYLTLRAATILSTCDVVAYDHLSPAEALDLVPARADRILVGRRSGSPGYSREEVDELLFARASAGHAVVRLKGGDPFVFGRGGEEGSACREAGIPFEIVPGVSSPIAVPGAAGIPVTHRTVSPGFAVVTGHEATDDASLVDYAALAAFPGTVVLLMGLARVRALADELMAHGRDPETVAAVVSAGTLPTQRSVVGTLATIADVVEAADLPAPAIIVVGDVVAMREQLSWRERRPLHGTRVLLPRLSQRTSTVAGELRHAGAAVIELHVAREEAGDPAALARLAVEVRDGKVGTLVALGADGMQQLVSSLTQVGADVRALAGTDVWAVGGRATARIRDGFGLQADRTFASPTALLAAAPQARGPVVVLAPDGADHGVAALLSARVVVSARTVFAGCPDVPAFDAVVVPTARLAGPVLAAVGDRLAPIVSMGPTTSAALLEAGGRVDVEAARPTGEALVTALVAALARP